MFLLGEKIGQTLIPTKLHNYLLNARSLFPTWAVTMRQLSIYIQQHPD